jgi:hypothetical protein
VSERNLGYENRGSSYPHQRTADLERGTSSGIPPVQGASFLWRKIGTAINRRVKDPYARERTFTLFLNNSHCLLLLLVFVRDIGCCQLAHLAHAIEK